MRKTLFTLVCFTGFIGAVNAAPTYKLTVSNSTVESGGKVTASVTVYNTAAWNIKIISAGNTNGCNDSWSDADANGNNITKTFSTTCKATSPGIISFTVSGDISQVGGGTTNLSGTQRVTVTVPREKSTINTLKSLSVEGYDLDKEFDAETLEYSLKVPSTVEKIKISASKSDKYSTVEGDGEVTVEEGINRFEINVISETGQVRTYVLNVDVEDMNPIKVNVNGSDYTIIKKAKNLDVPEGYVETSTVIDETEVPTFYNEVTNMTLIALKDGEGNVNFFKYENGKYTKYVELKVQEVLLYPQVVDSIPYKGFNKTTIKINDNDVEVFKYKKLEKYYLMYAMNLNSGDYNYYLYDSINDTYQVFDEELFNSLNSDIEFYMYMLFGAAGLIILCLVIILCISKKKDKRKVIKEPIIDEIKGEEYNLNENIEETVVEEEPTLNEEESTDEEVVEEEENFLDETPKKKKNKKKKRK